ncbi:MAG: hypothetical protein MRERC_1c190 [Mycoplasmataceae bacterium RC_NB112A]|nr:MAG: hypothetical protein MRERC_1c190 [Mycoplasmataceae bacterium RC_NB112A]
MLVTITHRERERERFDFHPREKKPKSKLWLGIILGSVVLAGTGTAIYFSTTSKKSETVS